MRTRRSSHRHLAAGTLAALVMAGSVIIPTPAGAQTYPPSPACDVQSDHSVRSMTPSRCRSAASRLDGPRGDRLGRWGTNQRRRSTAPARQALRIPLRCGMSVNHGYDRVGQRTECRSLGIDHDGGGEHPGRSAGRHGLVRHLAAGHARACQRDSGRGRRASTFGLVRSAGGLGREVRPRHGRHRLLRPRRTGWPAAMGPDARGGLLVEGTAAENIAAGQSGRRFGDGRLA